MQDGDLYDLQYCWDCNLSVVFPTLGLNTLQKLLIISKNALNKSCEELNFLQKTQRKQVFYLAKEWSYRVPNICHTLELKSRFFLRLKASKIIDCIEECFKQQLYETKFSKKTKKKQKINQWFYVFIFPRSGARGHQKFAIFKIMHYCKKVGSFRAELCQKYRLYRKMFQLKVAQN